MPNARWVALRLLDGDESIIQAVRSGDLGSLRHGDTEVVAHDMTIQLEVAR
ncbi:MAG: hypothetical protein R2856_14165 [Caldilineaceae bacterium]